MSKIKTTLTKVEVIPETKVIELTIEQQGSRFFLWHLDYLMQKHSNRVVNYPLYDSALYKEGASEIGRILSLEVAAPLRTCSVSPDMKRNLPSLYELVIFELKIVLELTEKAFDEYVLKFCKDEGLVNYTLVCEQQSTFGTPIIAPVGVVGFHYAPK